ncbi:MAG: PAS domain S-box protein [Syntrophales bacterium]|nr:PAS domain S-box protein [Syntrophales bacterium]
MIARHSMSLSHRWPVIAVAVTSLLCVVISVFFLTRGQFIIFQNLFYIPLIIACFYYGKRGFAYSVGLVFVYFFLVSVFTRDPIVLQGAAVRVGIFLLIAWIVATLSLARRQAEDTLEKEREKFRMVADFTYDWAYWTDPQQDLLYASPSCERISDYGPEEFMADAGLMSRIVHPEDMKVFRRHMDDYHKSCIDEVGEFEFRIVNRSGEERWIAHLCQPVYGNDGQFKGRRANNRDITDRKRAESQREAALEALRKSEENLRRERDRAQNYLDVAATMMIALGEDQRVTLINRKGCEVLGYPEDEIVGKNWFQAFIPADIRYQVRSLYDRIITDTGSGETHYENEVVDSKGDRRLIAWYNTILRDGEGKIMGVLTSGNDITEKKQMELALWESEERYRAFFEASRDGTFITAINGRWIDCNPAMADILGYNDVEALKLFHINEFYKDIEDRLRLEALLEERGYVQDYPADIRRKDGEVIHALITSIVRRKRTGEIIGYQGFIKDITERKRSEKTIHWLAYHDALTGLPNRTLFNDRLGVAIAQASREERPLAIMMFDLDKFKDVNDSLGHNVGDLLLKAVAKRMASLVREGDTVARMGGDEFLMVFSTIKQGEDVPLIAKKVVDAFQTPFICDGHKLTITTSLGISLYPKDGEDADTLAKNADIAMYKAKQSGRNRYVFYEEI